ncbi:MAG: prepilin-type N-terminal cleavage/methylation domain-containing protein [Candidatus Cloacimonetes bacterium]|nr:prepilin-type N-terminal cleavage/methylation domain-containing protein [Candidatus Cloacimonadota bacterium]MDY0172519.1 prepilin-type N-terminal cleavage/methylation domain-containing protein [Candidatus Cloacimonadaceae bacterium]
MTPRFLHDKTCLLNNERGVTLLEVLVTVAVLSVLVITVYIGIQFAEKQSVQNYRMRAATLLATGELDKQYFVNKYHTNQNDLEFRPFSDRSVVIDVIKKGTPLLGTQSVSIFSAYELHGSKQYPYTQVTCKVEWRDPSTAKTQYVVMREDFFVRAGD